MNHPLKWIATFCSLATLPAYADIQPIIHANQPLPGTSGQVVVDGLGGAYSASISRTGDIALSTYTAPPSSPPNLLDRNTALLLWHAGQLTTLFHSGQPFDDARTILDLDKPTLSPNGRYLAFTLKTSIPQDQPLSLHLNTPAPYLWDRTTPPTQLTPLQIPSNDTTLSFTLVNDIQANDAAQVAVSTSQILADTLYTGTPGQLQPLVSPGSPLPGGDLATPSGSRPIAITPAGQTLFVASTDDTSSPGSTGIYLGTPSNLQRVAVRNDPAPGIPNAYFSDLQQPRGLSDTGQTAFAAAVVGPGLHTTNDQGIWTGTPDSLNLLAREGDPVPGAPDQHFLSFSAPAISADNRVAFLASTLSATSPLGNPPRDSLWMTDPAHQDQLVQVAAKGDPAPGTDGTFTALSQFTLSDTTGLVAFIASVQLPYNDPAFSPTASGLWLGRPGDLHLLLLTHDPILLDGQSVLPSSINLCSDSSNSPLRITDDGHVLSSIIYQDPSASSFSNGLFLLSLPEPSLLALLPLTLLPRRRPNIS